MIKITTSLLDTEGASLPRKCSVCTHGEREAIDLALINRESYRDVARRFDVSRSAVERHTREHLPKSLSRAREAETVASASHLLAVVVNLQGRAMGILDGAEKAGDLRTALSAIREARGCIELLARLAGELHQTRHVDITVSPVWIEVRSKVLESLTPYPDARRAVAGALMEGGSGH